MTPVRTYRALLVSETLDGTFVRKIADRSWSDLPAGEVVVRVRYSSLNYKDALSATGNRGVTKQFPHVPGIDAAGVVEESSVPEWKSGQEVIVTGYELGSNHHGGFAEYVRVPAAWVVPLPAGLTLREAMAFGTAGLTAGLAVHRLLHHGLTADRGPVLVTGATGGVGSLSVAILAHLGFNVAASTGKTGEASFLKELGANEILDRSALVDRSGRGLLKSRWAGVVETVGGPTLDSVIRETTLFGAVAACGNVTSAELHTSVYPFILRGVALLGINSAFTPMPLRREVWARLGLDWKPSGLAGLAREIPLSALSGEIDRILAGGIRGRVIVNLQV